MFLEGRFKLKPDYGVKTRKVFLSMNENDKNPSFLLQKEKSTEKCILLLESRPRTKEFTYIKLTRSKLLYNKYLYCKILPLHSCTSLQ